MNLCLHQAGKLQCVPIASSVLDILVRLLVRDLKQVQRSKTCTSGDNIVLSDQPVRERRLVQLAGEQGYQHRGPGHGHREQDH